MHSESKNFESSPIHDMINILHDDQRRNAQVIHKLEHIGVMVKDMEVSIKFYTEVLGMKLVNRVQPSENLELAFLSFPGSENIEVELVKVSQGNDENPSDGVVNHIAFTVSDIDAEVARLKQLNVKLIDDEPRPFMDDMKIFFFYGPDGERLEFFQPKA